jgi:hypothetical protein
MSSYAWPRSKPGSQSVAVVLPGARYPARGPLLYWCAEILSELGWHVQAVEWAVDDGVGDPQPFVERAVAAAFDAAPIASRRLVVAKSFGTYAVPWARRAGIPGIWLTPILTDDRVRRGLLSATSADIAIGGDADELWLPEKIADSPAHVITVSGADHSLAIAGNWQRSLTVQNEVFMDIARHLDRFSPLGSGHLAV